MCPCVWVLCGGFGGGEVSGHFFRGFDFFYGLRFAISVGVWFGGWRDRWVDWDTCVFFPPDLSSGCHVCFPFSLLGVHVRWVGLWVRFWDGG